MFKAVMNHSDLSAVLDVLIKSSISDAKFQVSESGIIVRAIDPASVQLTHVEMPAKAFSFLMADKSDLGIDVDKLADMVSAGDKSDPVSLQLLEETGKLNIKSGRLDWSLSLIAPDSIQKEPKLPDLDLPCAAEIPSSEFQRTIKAAEKVGDSVRLSMTDDSITMETKAIEQSMVSKIPLSELTGLKLGVGSSVYSMNYLRDMAKSGSKSSTVKMEWGPDYPLRMSFDLGENGINVQYLLAPRIEQD